MGTTGGIRNHSSLSTGRPKIQKATALSEMDIWKYKTLRGHLTIHLDPWTSFLWAVVPSSMDRWDTNSSNSNFAKSTEACKLNHYGRVTFNLKEKLILEGNAEGPRPLKALPPVIWGGHIGFEKLVYLWSVCEKRTINTHEKFRGKWKMAHIRTYTRLYIYMCPKGFKFQTTRHIWSAVTDSLRVWNRTRKKSKRIKDSEGSKG